LIDFVNSYAFSTAEKLVSNFPMVKLATEELYKYFENMAYSEQIDEKIKEKFKKAKIIENEDLYDKHILTNIVKKLWKIFDSNGKIIDEETLQTAFSIWKTFAYKVEIEYEAKKKHYPGIL
jgi:hypothetical protein